MATRANQSVAKNEKKATPSLNSRTPRNKPTNNAIGGASAVTNKVKPTNSIPSSPSSKSVPNYLRPTSSSTKQDSSTPTNKKTINDDSTQNAARRRSFDRPPSAIRNQKSLISPDPKERVFSRERQLQSRSSSFSHSSSPKVPASPKNALERNSKSFKPIKSPQSSSFGWKSSSFSKTTGSLKNGSYMSSSNSTKPSPNENVEETNKLELETKESPIQENSNVETEEDHMQNIEINEDTVLESLQGTDNIEDETVSEDNSENTSNNSTQNLDPIEGKSSSEVLDENHEDENNYAVEKEENESSHSDIQPEEKERTADETETVEEGNEKENAIENRDSAEELEDEKKKEEKKVEPKEVEEGITKAEEKEAKNGVQKGQGKRESPAAYNDVIEETKNKLLQNRKNKVKALVGAFETVIDFETAAGSNSNK